MKRTIWIILLLACAITFLIVYNDTADQPLISHIWVNRVVQPTDDSMNDSNEEDVADENDEDASDEENEEDTEDSVDTNENENADEENDDTDNENTDVEENTRPAWTYEPFSSESLEASLNNGEKVVLFFHADRCPTCGALDTDISEGEESIPDNTTIYKVNYDQESELKEQYEVTAQHTLVFLAENGEALATQTGTPTLEELISDMANAY